MNIPEPVGYLVTFENGETEFPAEKTSLGESQDAIYTADALRDVLEQAAQECLSKHTNGNYKYDTRYECAEAIRALKDSIK